MLVNFIYMFQVIYKSFKCRLRFVRSAFIHTKICMQKNKVKAFISCCFCVKSEKNVGLIENLAQSLPVILLSRGEAKQACDDCVVFRLLLRCPVVTLCLESKVHA